jgi:integrase
MAHIKKVPLKTGGWSYRAIVREGSRQVLSKNFRRRADAKAWLATVTRDRERMEALGNPDGARSFRAVAEDMLKTPARDRHRGPRTAWWVERIGSIAIGRLTLQDLRPHLDAFAKDHGAGTVNRLRAALSSVFRHAIRQGWLAANPAKGLAHRPEPRGIVRWLEPEERARLLEACDASDWPKLGLLVRFLLATGCRLGEAQALRWTDIAWTSRTASLETTKNGDRRVLTLPPKLIAELRKHRAVGAGLVFDGFHFRKHWTRAREQAGLAGLRLHDLRHDAASQLAMSGATLHQIGEVLGHRSPVTSRRYAHLSTDHKQELTDRVLGGLL